MRLSHLRITQISSNVPAPTTPIRTLRRNRSTTLQENIRHRLDLLTIDIKRARIKDVDRILLAITIATAVVVEECPDHAVVKKQIR